MEMIATTRTNTNPQEKQQHSSLEVFGEQVLASPMPVAGAGDVRKLRLASRSASAECELGIAAPARVISSPILMRPRRCAITGLTLFCKRVIDFVLGGLLLLMAAPFMIVIWIAICCDSKGPGIIVQERIGYKGQPFKFYKFRTMYSNSDDRAHRTYVKEWMRNRPAGNTAVFKIVGDQRVTKVGAILRRYSLDELPQLFNVIKLDMSLVGPRPALPYEVEDYAAWHKERFEAPPGLTGLWQVSGRSLLSFEGMIRLDFEYLRNWSIGRDFEILAKTIPAVLRGTGY